jgi:hypothetical protein
MPMIILNRVSYYTFSPYKWSFTLLYTCWLLLSNKDLNLNLIEAENPEEIQKLIENDMRRNDNCDNWINTQLYYTIKN